MSVPARSLTLVLVAMTAGFAEESEQGPDPLPRIELEYVASDVFRSGTAIIKLWRGLHVESEYFGGPPYDVGISGVSWKFHWKGLSLSPGFGIGYGSPVSTDQVGTLRWTLETKRWYSQGFFAKSITGQEEREAGGEERQVGAAILDNNHFSIRIGPFELGPMWERIRYREEFDWKFGGRAAIRWKRFKGIFQAVTPGTEFRGGIAFEH